MNGEASTIQRIDSTPPPVTCDVLLPVAGNRGARNAQSDRRDAGNREKTLMSPFITHGYGGSTPELWWYLIDGRPATTRF